MAVTKKEVKERLRPVYEAAMRDRTGVSILFTSEEAEVFTMDDLHRFEEEIGYKDLR